MTAVSSTKIQNNFGYYLQKAEEGEIIIIMRNGKEVARLMSTENSKTFGMESLKGILKQQVSEDEIKLGRRGKYENIY